MFLHLKFDTFMPPIGYEFLDSMAYAVVMAQIVWALL
jgi:hypothetical protein